MCKGSNSCPVLGEDPETWDRFAPLRTPDWAGYAFTAFTQAVDAAGVGDLATADALLALTRERELNAWYDLHAQNIGTIRARHFGLEPAPMEVPLDPVKRFDRYIAAVMERDGYRCRYCGNPILTRADLKRAQAALGADRFPITRANTTTHGIRLVFSGTLDHVEPHSRGGRTDASNLVTACWPCNYGKANYTCAELGIEDPRRSRLDEFISAVPESLS